MKLFLIYFTLFLFFQSSMIFVIILLLIFPARRMYFPSYGLLSAMETNDGKETLLKGNSRLNLNFFLSASPSVRL